MKETSPLYYLGKFVCGAFLKTIWRLEVTGADTVPINGPAIIASNHRSYADPPLIGVSISRVVHFLAKKELFSFPPFGWLISRLNAHPLNRAAGTAAFKAAQEILDEGGVVILFPEGRRSNTDEIQKPKGGVGMLALKAKVPVIPAYIHNSGHLFELKRVSVHFGQPIDPTRFDDYHALASEVMVQIQKLKDRTLAKIW